MLRFILVVLANVKRGPYLIPKMRKMFHHPERYSEQVRYAFAQKLINYMKSSGKIKTEVYGTENLPLEGGYVMYPNHQGKYAEQRVGGSNPSTPTPSSPLVFI